MRETLPFRAEFRDAVLSGRKILTARTKRYPDGVYETGFGKVRVTAAKRITLKGVRDVFWREEGVDSPEDFERVWKEIHPRMGFAPERVVWLHQFEVIG